MYESNTANAKWQTCVVAKGPVKVLVLNYRDMKDLVAKRPEVEADIRAGVPLGRLLLPNTSDCCRTCSEGCFIIS